MNERIKEVRKSLGLTQQEFADRIGVKEILLPHTKVVGIFLLILLFL